MKQVTALQLFGNPPEDEDEKINILDAEKSKISKRKPREKVSKSVEAAALFGRDDTHNHLIPVPVSFKARDYQSHLFLDKIRPVSSAFGSVMVSMQTGGGKTVVGALILRSIYDSRTNTGVFIAHRKGLVTQTASRLRDQLGIPTGIIMSGHKFNPSCRVHSVSIMTVKPKNGSEFNKDPGDNYRRLARLRPKVVIVDEAHRIAGVSYRNTIKRLHHDALSGTYNGGKPYDPPIVVGLTATPWRLDGEDLYSTCKAMVSGPTPAELSNMGKTVPPFAIYTPTGNLEAALDLLPRNEFGDYQEEALAELMMSGNRPQDAAAMWLAYRDDPNGNPRPTITFCVTVDHAKSHVEALREVGARASVIYAATSDDDRRKAIEELERGDINVLVNVGIATEGVDIPCTSMVHILRPTNSLSLWIQMAGRGGRPDESVGKTHYLLLDQVGNLGKHGRPDAPRIWSLLGWKMPARLRKDKKALLPNGDENWRYAPKPPKPPLLIEFPNGERCVIAPDRAESIVAQHGAFAVLPFSMASTPHGVRHLEGETSNYVVDTPLAYDCPDHQAFAKAYPLLPSMRLTRIVGGGWHYYEPHDMALAIASRLSKEGRQAPTVVRECLRVNPLMNLQQAEQLIPYISPLARPGGVDPFTAQGLVIEAAKIRGEAHLPDVLSLPTRHKDSDKGIWVHPPPQ